MAITALLSAAAFAQTVDSRPAFEIADVHVSPNTRNPAMRTVSRVGRYEIRTATLVDLIATAWGVEPDKVLGGPGWLEMDRFDVITRPPLNAAPPALRQMLQSLLAERFQLAIHMDQKPTGAFVLSVGNGKPKLKESDASGAPGCTRQPASEGGAIPATCHGLSMQVFAQQLRAAAGDYLTSGVIDETNLAGSWDFTLKWTPRGRLAAAGADGITIFDAIDKQLGLKLEPKQVPSPVIVVDRVNQKPTDNAPGTAATLPAPPPPHFEVATIKRTDPQFQGVRIQTPPNGAVMIQGVTLSYLIQTIWFLTPEMIAEAPKWLDTDRWDITAKVAAAPGIPPQTDMDSLIVMVRTLLEDRFQLKTHTEERVVPAYTLAAAKPKLRKGDPADRTGCKEGPGADGRDPRITNPALSRLVACRNMTMDQFAAQLPRIANALNPLNGPIRSTVLNATGLDGTYDFTLSFSPGQFFSPGGTPAPPIADGPSDPNGLVSLPEAIGRQLGLRLALEKRPATVLVIDHIEEKPADN
ncbi:MAG TPA: TIGR03435 family protein [Bryobacteraceae bacterium]|nr:TIGR03435 family protein [Bryobacteraceae bacterium]